MLQELSDDKWNNIPMCKINQLIGSMESRIQEGVNARGGQITRY